MNHRSQTPLTKHYLEILLPRRRKRRRRRRRRKRKRRRKKSRAIKRT